jgi:hypothetical protein
VVLCGNGTCDGLKGESCVTCPDDCECAQGRTCIEAANACILTCGDNACVPAHGENCVNCPDDCGCGADRECVASNGTCRLRCGNGQCEAAAGENCSNCTSDCACNSALQECHEGACRLRCGNGVCDTSAGEGCATCDVDCPCSGAGNDCVTNTNSCVNRCGDTVCDAGLGENCNTCLPDCGCNARTEECFNNACRSRCGNGSCEPGQGENCTSCASDCACSGGDICNGQGQCEPPAANCGAPCSFEWVHATDLKVNATAQGSIGGAIALDPGGTVFVGYAQGTSYKLAKLAPGASAFAQVASINGLVGVDFYGTRALVSGGANQLYALWDYWDNDGVQPYLGSWVKSAASSNGGANWSQEVIISKLTDNSSEGSLAIQGGVLYASYRGYLTGCSTTSNHNCYEVFFTKSTNGGATWSTPVRLSNDSDQDNNTAVAVDGQSVVVAWKTFEPPNIWVVRSSNGGATFSAPVRVNDVAGKVQYGWHNFIALRGQRVHVAWSDTRDDYEGEIYADSSADGGATWGTDVHVNDVGRRWQEQPSVQIAPDGRVWVLWRDFRNGDGPNSTNYDLYAASSVDGRCFCASARFNRDPAGAQTEPYFVIDAQGKLHAIWRDSGTGPDVNYQAATPTSP